MKKPRRPPSAFLVLQAFEELEDPRQHAKVRHPLTTILLIAIGAVLSGTTEWQAMADWAVDHADWLTRHAPGGTGQPSADTLRRVFERLRPDVFARCFETWMRSLATTLAGQHLAVDGKSVAGAVDPAQPTVPLFFLHVWAVERRLLLAARAIDGAPAEPATLVAVLALLDIHGAVLTADANLTTAATTAAVVGGGGDYVFALKGNRGPQFDEAVAWFGQTAEGGAPGATTTTWTQQEKGHGRRETRRALAAPIAHFPRCVALFAGAASVVRLERTRRSARRASYEVVYYVSSLPPDAPMIMEYVRQHWAIENEFHGALDVVLHEDDCVVPKGNAAKNLAIVRRLGIGQLQRDTTLRRSLAGKMRRAAAHDVYREHLLSLGTQ